MNLRVFVNISHIVDKLLGLMAKKQDYIFDDELMVLTDDYIILHHIQVRF